jgi:hypothetical protein
LAKINKAGLQFQIAAKEPIGERQATTEFQSSAIMGWTIVGFFLALKDLGHPGLVFVIIRW